MSQERFSALRKGAIPRWPAHDRRPDGRITREDVEIMREDVAASLYDYFRSPEKVKEFLTTRRE